MSEAFETRIHPSAVVEDGAAIGAGVEIGPFCHVGPQVQIGDGVKLVSHVVVAGRTTIGPRTRIYPFASIGHPPQDLKFRGEDSTLTIGADCQIREGVTMNPGTAGGGLATVVGDGARSSPTAMSATIAGSATTSCSPTT